MAVQLESQNQLLELIDMLKRRRWWIILPALIVISIGTAVVVFLPKKYEVTAQVKIQEVRVDDPGKLGSTPKGTATQREIQNAQYQIKQSDRIISILEYFDWQDFREKDGQERWEYTQRVQRNIGVAVLAKQKDEGSTYIDITYKDTDPTRAETFLNELALRWQRDLQKEDIENLSTDLGTTRKLLDDNEQVLAKLEKEISDLQNELEIFPSLTEQSGRNEDPLQGRRSDLELELSKLLLEIGSREVLLEDLVLQYNAEPELVVSPPGAIDEALAKLTEPFDKAVAALQVELDKLKPGNSAYQALNDQIRAQQQQKAALLANLEKQRPEAREEPNPLKESLRQQKLVVERELKALNGQSDQLRLQIEDLSERLRRRTDGMARIRQLEQERASTALAARDNAQKLNATSFNLQLIKNRTEPYSIVEPARATKNPTEPNVPLLLGFVLAAGLGLGFLLAFLVEYSQPGFRNPGEAVRALSVPVLGIVDDIPTRPVLRRRRWNRAVVAISSSLIIGGMGWFAWAWTRQPDLLGTDLVLWLTELQENLK
jgi:uncharacterized protein involved in exopolysaccharide biosynthesis